MSASDYYADARRFAEAAASCRSRAEKIRATALNLDAQADVYDQLAENSTFLAASAEAREAA